MILKDFVANFFYKFRKKKKKKIAGKLWKFLEIQSDLCGNLIFFRNHTGRQIQGGIEGEKVYAEFEGELQAGLIFFFPDFFFRAGHNTG